MTAACAQKANVELENFTDEVVTFVVSGAEHDVPALGAKTLTDLSTTSGTLAVEVIQPYLDAPVPLTHFTWTDPGDCPTTPSPSPSGSLASTGQSMTGLITTGAVLLAVGVALLMFLGMRRRRADAS